MKISNLHFLTLLSLILLSSCVPLRKYQDLQSQNDKLSKQYKDSVTQLKLTSASLQREQLRAGKLSADRDDLQHRLDELQVSYNQSQKLNKDLNDVYEKLIAQNKQISSKATDDYVSLSKQLLDTKAQLDQKDIDLRKAERNLDAKTQAYEQLQKDLKDKTQAYDLLSKDVKDKDANIKNLQGDKSSLEKSVTDREKQIKELEAAINAQKEQSNALKNKITNALKSFSSDELTVTQKNGKIYVSLSQQLLFASGSKMLDKKGKDALNKLGEVLKKNQDSEILVEGHTDSDGDDRTNWDLSVGRAVVVVSELIKGGVDPTKIEAAGRGKHAPVAPNTSSDGKAQNRRTEIILSPKLTDLYKIIDK